MKKGRKAANWNAWSRANKFRFIFVRGGLLVGGLCALLGGLAITAIIYFSPGTINSPTLVQSLLLIGLCIMSGLWWGWKMWPIIEKIKTGRYHDEIASQRRSKRVFILARNVLFSIFVGYLLVWLTNYMRELGISI